MTEVTAVISSESRQLAPPPAAGFTATHNGNRSRAAAGCLALAGTHSTNLSQISLHYGSHHKTLLGADHASMEVMVLLSELR